MEAEIIKKQGSFYSYGETRLGQGREQSKAFLRENPDMAQELEALIRGPESAENGVVAAGVEGK